MYGQLNFHYSFHQKDILCNSFQPKIPFLYHQKTSENPRYADVFSQLNKTVTCNELIRCLQELLSI